MDMKEEGVLSAAIVMRGTLADVNEIVEAADRKLGVDVIFVRRSLNRLYISESRRIGSDDGNNK